MFKQIIMIIVLSVLIVLAMPYVQQGLQFLLAGHTWISDLLKEIFAGGQAGNVIRQLIALLAIPVVASIILAILYWLAKRTWFPYFMEVVWVIWLVQTAALAVLYK